MRLAILLTLFGLVCGSVHAEEYIVRFSDDIHKSNAHKTIEANGLSVKSEIPQLNMYVAETVSKRKPDLLSLAKAAGVLYVEPNYRRAAIEVPNDKNYRLQHGLKAFGAERAWDIHRGSRDVVVAVIDTGVYLAHADLKNQLWVNKREIPGNNIDDDGNGFVDDIHGWDFINNDNNPNDDESHGTHCAGIIGAETNNGEGVAGVTWNVQIMAVKFLGASGSGSDSDGILGIIYATDNGADIISASWGSTEYSQALADGVKYAADRGVLFVAAAGNAGANNDAKGHYPSNYDLPNVISVGAANSGKLKADFSNYGKTRVHVAAPGVDIFSTINSKNGYGRKSGTSMATPMVAGAAALLLGAHPNLSMTELRNAILNAVEPASAWAHRNATGGFARVDWALEQFAAGPQVWPKYLRLAAGSAQQMTAFQITGAKWAVSDSSVLNVDGNGHVTAVGPGTAEVLVTDAAGVVRSATIEVLTVQRSGGCSALPADGAATVPVSNAGATWPALLFLLPLLVGAYLRRRS